MDHDASANELDQSHIRDHEATQDHHVDASSNYYKQNPNEQPQQSDNPIPPPQPATQYPPPRQGNPLGPAAGYGQATNMGGPQANNYMFQNNNASPNRPAFQAQPAGASQVQKVQMGNPVQFPNQQYFQTNPVYQTRSVNPPAGPTQTMEPHSGYNGGPTPVNFPPDNNGHMDYGINSGYVGPNPGNGIGAAPGIPVPKPNPNPQVQAMMMQQQQQQQLQAMLMQQQQQQQLPSPQVQAMMMQQQMPRDGWQTGLFECMDDPNNAVITAFCPCVTFGQVAEILDNGHTTCATSGMLYGLVAFLIGFPFIMSCSYRTKLRSKFNLMETPAPDWVTHLLCECCALCQEYRELQRRGLDPAIGWQGNVDKVQAGFLQQQANMMPPMHQRMMP